MYSVKQNTMHYYKKYFFPAFEVHLYLRLSNINSKKPRKPKHEETEEKEPWQKVKVLLFNFIIMKY